MYDFKKLRDQNLDGDPNDPNELKYPPWAGFDPSCTATAIPGGMAGDPENFKGFHPIIPWLGGPDEQNLAAYEAKLADVEARLADPSIDRVPRGRFLATEKKHRYASYIAQLKGEPGAIPDAAGDEYKAWVAWLREHDPNRNS